MPSRRRTDAPVRPVWTLSGMPAWSQVVLVACLLAGCWALVYSAGGTRTAFPHVFYIPILLAALPFGVGGAVAAGIAATLLAGPAIPVDTVTGEAQQLVNWLIRGGFFVTVGALSGASVVTLRDSFHAELVARFTAEMDLELADAPAVVNGERERRVRRALDERRYRPVFQPIYDLDDGALIAVEALTRFEGDPYLPPDVWFAEAAEAGLGIELELATLEAALDASGGLDPEVALSFNASPDLLSDPRLLDLLGRYDGRSLIAEVTEHVIVEDYHRLVDALTVLRARGLRLAVDDAGAGFASFRHVVRLRPDYIKLDRSLTQHLDDDPIRRPLADCLIEFARRTSSEIIAEGIETPADLATWQHLGARAAQGYLLGRPGQLPVPSRMPYAAGLQGAAAGRVRRPAVLEGRGVA